MTVGDNMMTVIFSNADSGKVKVQSQSAGGVTFYSNPQAGLSAKLTAFVGINGAIESAIIGIRFKDAKTGKDASVSGEFNCH